MNEYQLGFTHACRLIKNELSKKEIPKELLEIIDFVEKEEIEQIKKDMGFIL